jgi:hypothetical protein
MIGAYGQVTQEENGWFDCQGASGWMPWSVGYCQIVKPAVTGVVQPVKQGFNFLKTATIILLLLGAGTATFAGINAFRKKRKTRKNPRKKKQSIGNRIGRVLGGAVLTGLGALGYAGPQAAEPISTVIGGGMSLSGLYLIGSGVVGVDQAKKIRKEIMG